MPCRLIEQLQIGYLDTTPAPDDDSDEDFEEEKPSYLPNQMSSDGFAMPAPRNKKG